MVIYTAPNSVRGIYLLLVNGFTSKAASIGIYYMYSYVCMKSGFYRDVQLYERFFGIIIIIVCTPLTGYVDKWTMWS